MKQALISIIVPVYNAADYLDRCMSCLLGQTYQNTEIILINDGSSDASGEMCDRYAAKQKKVTAIHQSNRGASAARNTGIGRSKGDFLVFMDSDDLMSKDCIDYLYHLQAETKADIVKCDYTLQEREIRQKQSGGNIRIYTKETIWPFFYRMHCEKSNYAVWGTLYSKRLMEKLRFREGIITEDVLFTYDACCAADKIVFSDLRKYFYYCNADGVSRSRLQKKDLALLMIWDEITEREGQAGSPERLRMAGLNRKRAVYTLYVKGLVHGVSKDFDKDIFPGWRMEIRRNYQELLCSGILDFKRKIILFLICKTDFCKIK